MAPDWLLHSETAHRAGLGQERTVSGPLPTSVVSVTHAKCPCPQPQEARTVLLLPGLGRSARAPRPHLTPIIGPSSQHCCPHRCWLPDSELAAYVGHIRHLRPSSVPSERG